MKTERVALSTLVMDDKNARKHSKRNLAEIKRSLKDFGQHRPFVVQRGTNKILIGNGMYAAMQALGWETADVWFVDDDDKTALRRALADNRTAELAEWDSDILNELIGSLDSLDVPGWTEEELNGLLKFESSGIDELDNGDGDGKSGKNNYGLSKLLKDYRLDAYDDMRVSGYYQFPTLRACHVIPDRLVKFSYVSAIVKDKNRAGEYAKGVHFFISDFKFERLWNDPQTHIKRLKNFACALTPDFSLYLDMPMAMKIWNIYRSRLMGQMMQDAGINVIPTLMWAEEETLKFCFDGIESGGVVATSTIGVLRDRAARKTWTAGMDVAIEKLRPKAILCYGFEPIPDYDFHGINVKYFEAETFWKRGSV